MARFHPRALMTRFALSALTATMVFSSACSKDPYDPQTWIDKLDDPKELKEAITKLGQLNCPEAIKPLGEVWRKHNHWSRVLHLIITLADQPNMVKGNENFPDQDCPDAGEGPYWKDAVPYLIEAVEDFDVTDPEEIQDATSAANALGKAGSKDAIQVLISAANKKMKLRQGQLVKIAAVKALGSFGDNKRVVDTLVKVLETKPKMETIRLNAAAANALAATRSKDAVQPLLIALFNIPPIYQQIRTALTTIGKPVVPELLKIFKGTHSALNAFATKNKFAINCETKQGPGSECIAPGNLRFKSASLIGDMRIKEAIPALTSALGQAPRISFFDPKSGAPGPTDHNAILDALRKMGAFSAAGKVGEYMKAESTQASVRPLAVDAYSMLAKSTKELDFLKNTFQNKENPMPLRQASTLAYSRLVTSNKQIAPIQAVIDLQLKSAKEQDKKAKKAKTEKAKKDAQGAANDYRGFAREYEQHRTRARVGVVCGKDITCYSSLLTMEPKALMAKLQVPNHRRDPKKPMKKQDMQAYRIAAMDRALLEIAKAGKGAAASLDTLLKHVESNDRIVRQGVLLALVQVAPSPCNQCVSRLNQVIESQSSQTTLDNLNSDTRIVMNYFITHGASVPPKGSAAKAEANEKTATK